MKITPLLIHQRNFILPRLFSLQCTRATNQIPLLLQVESPLSSTVHDARAQTIQFILNNRYSFFHTSNPDLE